MKAMLGLIGLAAVLVVAPAAGAEDVNGKWKGAFDLHGNSVPLVLNFKVAGADLTGTVEGLPTTPAEIHEGKIDGENVTFWINSDYQGNTYKIVYKGKVVGDHIDFSFGTEEGNWGTNMTVKKESAVAAAELPKPIDITGAWKGKFEYNGTSLPLTFNLKSTGAEVTGDAEGMGIAPMEIHDGKIEGDLLSFWVNADYQGQTYVVKYKGKVTPNQIDFDFGTADGGWSSNLTVKK